MGDAEQFEVAILPWHGGRRTITLGPVTFSPLQNVAVDIPAVSEYFARYFPRYVEVNGQQIEFIMLAVHADVHGFRYHTDAERLTVNRAASALAFANVTNVQADRQLFRSPFGVPSADSFQVVLQRFAPGSASVAVSSARTLHSWPLSEVTFARPWSASVAEGKPDSAMLEAAGALLSRPQDFPSEFQTRVWRCLEWFRLAHLDGAEQTDEAKIVAMATAFESLLGLPQHEKQFHFAQGVQALVVDADMQSGLRLKGRKSQQRLELSLAGCWAWDFYDLRSRLVHGEALSVADFTTTAGLSHLVVADLALRECLLRQLLDRNCFGSDLRDAAAAMARHSAAAFPDDPTPFAAIEWESNQRLRFRRLHEKLGWTATDGRSRM